MREQFMSINTYRNPSSFSQYKVYNESFKQTESKWVKTKRFSFNNSPYSLINKKTKGSEQYIIN